MLSSGLPAPCTTPTPDQCRYEEAFAVLPEAQGATLLFQLQEAVVKRCLCEEMISQQSPGLVRLPNLSEMKEDGPQE